MFKRNEIIFLLGAGASVEAKIPDSNSMVRRLERLVYKDSDWDKFRGLYHYIRSAIFYADGLNGVFGDDVPFNIERLVNVLEEIQKKERHALYPFVGAWNPKLSELAGNQFELVREFRKNIVGALREKWVALSKNENAGYYEGLIRFQEEYGHSLRVFSLNYDLCVETICGHKKIQRGFDERIWDWRLFDETSDDPKEIMLYKLHGSVDWGFTDNGGVTYSDAPSTIDDDRIALIFGTSYKLQYIDPFLFFVYELRRWTLDAARVIVCIGYGFSDEHINGILKQSLRQDRHRRLISVVEPIDDASQSDRRKELIVKSLESESDQIHVIGSGAKEFLTDGLSLASLEDVLPDEEDDFQEIGGLST